MSEPNKSPRTTGTGVVRPRPDDDNGTEDDDMEDPGALFARLMADAKTTMLAEVREEIGGHNKLIDQKLESVIVNLDKNQDNMLSKTKSYIDAMDAKTSKKIESNTKALEVITKQQVEQAETNKSMLDKITRIEAALNANPSAASSSNTSNIPIPRSTLADANSIVFPKTAENGRIHAGNV